MTSRKGTLGDNLGLYNWYGSLLLQLSVLAVELGFNLLIWRIERVQAFLRMRPSVAKLVDELANLKWKMEERDSGRQLVLFLPLCRHVSDLIKETKDRVNSRMAAGKSKTVKVSETF